MLGLEEKHSNGTSYIPLANRRRTRSGLFQPSNRRQHRSVHCFLEMDGVLLTPVGKPSTTSKRDGWAELSGQAWDFPPPLEILESQQAAQPGKYPCSRRPDSPIHPKTLWSDSMDRRYSTPESTQHGESQGQRTNRLLWERVKRVPERLWKTWWTYNFQKAKGLCVKAKQRDCCENK